MGSLRMITLLDSADIGAQMTVEFDLAASQVPATISCTGVATSGEDIEIQKRVNGAYETVKEAGTSKILNGNNTALAINSPGSYRIKTADVAYASDDTSVTVEF